MRGVTNPRKVAKSGAKKRKGPKMVIVSCKKGSKSTSSHRTGRYDHFLEMIFDEKNIGIGPKNVLAFQCILN